MEKKQFPGGVWPVMVTPFTEDNQIDYEALEKLVDWYIDHGVKGLFAVCQSSEMFFLDLKERLKIAAKVVEASRGRVPVIASGHVSEAFEDQVTEINEMAKTGVEAVILITNRLAKEEENDDIWMERCKELLKVINPSIPLGFYECPFPYKRLLSVENLKQCAAMGRFYFLKDTCCDLEQLKEKIDVVRGTELKVYNANTTTLLESLKLGAAGYSGVMANFHPQLYAYLCDHFTEESTEELEDFLSIASLIERQCYPVNAKFHLRELERLPLTTCSRTKEKELLTDAFKAEVKMLNELSELFQKKYLHSEEGSYESGDKRID